MSLSSEAERDFRFALCPSVSPSVSPSVRISFLDFFPKHLQILTWFLACKSVTMIYRSSLSFITLHQFWAVLRRLDLVNFSVQTVFRICFLKACRYWPDFWHVSQSSWFTDQVWVSLRSIDFLAKLRALDLVNFSYQTVFRTLFLNASRYGPDFLSFRSITMVYRSSLTFVTLHKFLAKLRALDLVNFNDQTVFQTFFLNACRYWPDFWHVSQSPWLTDWVWVSLRSTDFWWSDWPLT